MYLLICLGVWVFTCLCFLGRFLFLSRGVVLSVYVFMGVHFSCCRNSCYRHGLHFCFSLFLFLSKGTIQGLQDTCSPPCIFFVLFGVFVSFAVLFNLFVFVLSRLFRWSSFLVGVSSGSFSLDEWLCGVCWSFFKNIIFAIPGALTEVKIVKSVWGQKSFLGVPLGDINMGFWGT